MRRRTGIYAALGLALLSLVAVFAAGNDSADAHSTVHPQKKLFTGRWYKSSVDLTASPPWFGVPNEGAQPAYPCDGGFDTASCVSKWLGPAYSSLGDWNSQPSTARFNVQGYRNHNWDNNVYIVDNIPGASPGLLGFASFHDQNGQACLPQAAPGVPYCPVYRYGDAVIIDDNHFGVFGTAQSRQATITHELGHVLTLRHESVNADESVRYECGQDNTGPIPVSVMSYDCAFPPGPPYHGAGIYTAQPWDVCGVNHAYPDPNYEWEGCVCYPPPGGGPAPVAPPGYYHPVSPARILDTRAGLTGYGGSLGYGCHINVQVTGVGGVPASGVSAVVLNVTTTQPSRGSFLTVYPSDAGLPTASNLNFLPGQTVPNLVTVKVGADGKVKLYNAAGQTHVIFDVVGWYGETPDGPPPMPTPTPTPDPGGYGFYHPLPPKRILDTRANIGYSGKVGHNGTISVDVTDTYGSGVPAAGVTAVVLNATVTEPNAGSFLAVWPADAAKPNASNLNFGPGQTVPNLVIVKVGAWGAADGKVNVYNAVGQVHVIFDVVGWYGGPGTDGTLFRSLPPIRIMDTRLGLGWPGKLGHNGTASVDVTGVGGVPEGAKGVIVNATVTEGTAGSFITVYPSDVPQRPTASNLNFGPGQTVPNLVMIKVPTTGPTPGRVNVYNAAGQVHVIFDVVGYFE
jgi:hypothetical protein